jgi:transcriptional regulator with PAS, ATPase and Fis domain
MPDCFIAASKRMKGVFDFIERAAPSDASVLIFGESGTGKELVAGALHQQSARLGRPYLRVNCAALNPNLLVSEMFGYERGAFTGADRLKLGKFEQANGGTLFLDEIGEMDPQAQAMLLRVLEVGEVDRLGGGRPIPVDVRVIAASNRDLRQAVRRRKFREDLFYRLAVLHVEIPPLRERKDDIPALTWHFMERFSRKRRMPVTAVSPEAEALLQDYDWPGNVRELRNAVHHAAVMCPQDVIDAKHVLPALHGRSIYEEVTEEIPADDMRGQILRAYATHTTVEAIARVLDVHPKYLPRLLKRNRLEYLKRRS